MTTMTRYIIGNYIHKNSDANLNDNKLSDLIQYATNLSTLEYVSSVVLEYGSNAKDITLYVAPLAFKINLCIVIFDLYDKDIVLFA